MASVRGPRFPLYIAAFGPFQIAFSPSYSLQTHLQVIHSVALEPAYSRTSLIPLSSSKTSDTNAAPLVRIFPFPHFKAKLLSYLVTNPSIPCHSRQDKSF